jgi:transposase
MFVVAHVFALRSERLICREVQVNLAYRWFCKLGNGHRKRLLIGVDRSAPGDRQGVDGASPSR